VCQEFLKSLIVDVYTVFVHAEFKVHMQIKCGCTHIIDFGVNPLMSVTFMSEVKSEY